MQKKTAPLVSIVVTTYNHVSYIRQTLDGIFMQKVDFDTEIIIHDDASTDGTDRIIKEYEEKHRDKVTAIYQKENQYSKGKKPLAFLWKYITGKYVARCEGDDYWCDQYKLKKQIDLLENNPNFVGVTHNVKVINEKGRDVPDKYHIYKILDSHVYTLKNFEEGELPSQTAALVYKNIWGLMDDEMFKHLNNCRGNGDVKIALLLTLYGDIYYMPDVMAVHRKIITYGTSWSASTHGKNLFLERFVSDLELSKFAKDHFAVRLKRRKRLNLAYQAFIQMIIKPNKENSRIYIAVLRKSGLGAIESIAYTFLKAFFTLIKRTFGFINLRSK